MLHKVILKILPHASFKDYVRAPNMHVQVPPPAGMGPQQQQQHPDGHLGDEGHLWCCGGCRTQNEDKLSQVPFSWWGLMHACRLLAGTEQSCHWQGAKHKPSLPVLTFRPIFLCARIISKRIPISAFGCFCRCTLLSQCMMKRLAHGQVSA